MERLVEDIKSYPDEDEDPGVSYPVLALGHAQHRELRRALTLRHQITNLNKKKSQLKLGDMTPGKELDERKRKINGKRGS